MRYTTVIDISEQPAIYKNVNCRLLYLHMSLKAGYHDTDRDLVNLSIRRLAYDAGLTVSATRFALAKLEQAGLIARIGNLWTVKKWLAEPEITPRARTKRQQEQITRAAERRASEEQRARQQEIERASREKLMEAGKTNFMVWYEAMEKRAEAGDIEAQESVRRNRAVYEQHKASMKRNDGKEIK